jgi:hypothetical protein
LIAVVQLPFAALTTPTANALWACLLEIEFPGRPWGEPNLLKLAFGFEQD